MAAPTVAVARRPRRRRRARGTGRRRRGAARYGRRPHRRGGSATAGRCRPGRCLGRARRGLRGVEVVPYPSIYRVGNLLLALWRAHEGLGLRIRDEADLYQDCRVRRGLIEHGQTTEPDAMARIRDADGGTPTDHGYLGHGGAEAIREPLRLPAPHGIRVVASVDDLGRVVPRRPGVEVYADDYLTLVRPEAARQAIQIAPLLALDLVGDPII